MRKEKELEWTISLEVAHRVLHWKLKRRQRTINNNSQLSSAQLRTITIFSSAKFEAQLFFCQQQKSANFEIFFIFKLFTYRKWCYSYLFNWLCILGLFWLGHCIFWFTVLGPRLENFIEKERIRYVLITCFHEFCN